MLSAAGEKAIEDSLRAGKAILKFLSANDVRGSQSHQFGPLLPKQCWHLFSPHPPKRGMNEKSFPTIRWSDGTETASCITWYGNKKSEYRLTRFGRDFPFLTASDTGSLLVLVPHSLDFFTAFVLDLEEDIEGVFEHLGVEISEAWGGYYEPGSPQTVDFDSCLDTRIRQFLVGLKEFPSTAVFAATSYDFAIQCNPTFTSLQPDEQLLELMRIEYELFRRVEQTLCANDIQGKLFGSVDQFIQTALSLLNRRKTRAGRSLENHFGRILENAGIQFEARALVQGAPDVLIPSKAAYDDTDFPAERLLVVGVKRTCKDRWRQILQEAPRAKTRFLFTLQQGISEKQFAEMTKAGISVIVPKPYHSHFPAPVRRKLLSVADAISFLQQFANVNG